MKFLNYLASITLLMVMTLNLTAQEAEEKKAEKPKKQIVNVHVDEVKPSKYLEYIEIEKELVALCKKHGIEDVNWMTVEHDDMKFSYVTPLDGMGDLDDSYFSTLFEKAGKEVVMDIFNRMDKCYDKHYNMTLALDYESSYMPNGMEINMTDQLHRDFAYYYFEPQNYDALKDLVKKYKKAYVAANSDYYYRIYWSGYGSGDQYLMVVSSGKSESDLAKKREMNREKMKDSVKDLKAQFLQLVTDMDFSSGEMRPDLSYGGNTLSQR